MLVLYLVAAELACPNGGHGNAVDGLTPRALHAVQVPRRKALHSRKSMPQVSGESVDNLGAPPLGRLPFLDRPDDLLMHP